MFCSVNLAWEDDLYMYARKKNPVKLFVYNILKTIFPKIFWRIT